MKKLILTAAMVLAATPAFAAHWNVDYAKSKLGFSVPWSGQPFAAVFKTWKSDIDFDPAAPAQAHVVTTIDIGSEASDTSDNDDGLKGPQGFDTSKFPTAKFEAAGFKPAGAGKYVANGTLTIRGVSKPLSLPFSLTLNGDSAHMTGRAQVMRLDFGVGQAEAGSADPVGHAVTVNIDLVAAKAH